MLVRVCLFCLCFIGLNGQAWAQLVEDYIQTGPAPDWVVEIDPEPLSEDIRLDVNLALVDYQNRHDATNDTYYRHWVTDLLTPAGVDDEGLISVDFDPSYQSVTLNRVDIIRENRRIDAIDLSEAMVFRTETDRDEMIFNGTLTFSMPVLDLRVGDRLDYAYTISGRNPAIGPHFLSRRSFQSSNAVERMHYRIWVHDEIPLHTKAILNPPKPTETREGVWRILSWDSPDPAVTGYDDNVPAWTYTRPAFEMSSLDDWSEVGALFADYYTVTPDDRDAVAPIVASIAAEHADSAVRTKAALTWVQSNIRYVGLELGEGGFIPRSPSRVLRRRFGDCKDVTKLLLSLLDGLDIEAAPLLVDMDERGGEFDGLPHPYAFDHIIVVADVNGQSYPLDATGDPQLGTLQTMERSTFRKGLRLNGAASRVIDIVPNDYESREYFREVFDFVTDPTSISYEFELTETGSDADGARNWIARQGRDAVEQSYVDYLRDRHPTLELVEPLSVTYDESSAQATTRMKFSLPRDETTKEIKTRAYQILGAMPDFEGADRQSPLAMDHPRDIRHVREYIVSDDYTFTDKAGKIETNDFAFAYEEINGDGSFTEDYRWTTKADHIKVDDFAETMKKVRTIQDFNYTTITLAAELESTTEEPSSFIVTLMSVLPMILFFGGLAFFMLRSKA